jgi:hypothetical protein
MCALGCIRVQLFLHKSANRLHIFVQVLRPWEKNTTVNRFFQSLICGYRIFLSRNCMESLLLYKPSKKFSHKMNQFNMKMYRIFAGFRSEGSFKKKWTEKKIILKNHLQNKPSPQKYLIGSYFFQCTFYEIFLQT